MSYKSLICPIEGNDREIDRALTEIESFGKLEGLSDDKISKLRLVGEEIIGMAEGILQVENGRFWIEKNEDGYVERFACQAKIGDRARALFDATAENKEYKGLAGLVKKVVDAAERMIEVSSAASSNMGIDIAYEGGSVMDATGYVWSLDKYEEICERDEKVDKWDELELSVLKKLSKNIVVSYRNDRFDIEVYTDI